MSTSVSRSRTSPPPAVGAEDRILLRGVDRAFYDHLVAVRGENPNPRIAWFGEDLELMSPSIRHEDLAELLGLLVRIALTALGVEHRGLGRVTMTRPGRPPSKEADACFYIANLAHSPARSARELDLAASPPPDLAIEVEISRPGVPVEAIYAGLGVLELWRCDGQRLRILRLGPNGRYAEQEHSGAVPRVRADDVIPLIARAEELGDLAWTANIERWAREDLAQRPA
ncbi:Uma2 family endonuclease [Tautonia plasticadhaerens]|uniref:Putative restriction endonuclease domain-containing protein n=1 Tax=Tautonia plasticadhaerens TaxID=2527974 RepID=A0A518HFE9_9BACT|nr:Uma2 family endonuclease [Tautonia plasticadhaerens]QDV39574.1 hypothetical protein ElP_75450 [Tautonia plasticadhaerens]